MDVISISDSTDGSVGIRSLLFHYSAKSAPKLNEDSPSAEEPISLSSESTERCPVTWKSKQKRKINLMKNLMSEKTPCATAKVESWLTQNNTKNSFSTLQLEALDGSTVLRLEPLKQGGSILIRHDYNKDLISSYTNVKPCYLSRKIFSTKKQNLDEGEVIYLDSDCSNKSASEGCGNINEMVDCSNPNPSDDKSEEKKKSKQKVPGVPLSPESQKKNELCSYLQLMDMNCTDKKIGSIIQNRRSVRVQNLNMLSERKKLEQELRCETKGEAIVSEGEAQENVKDLAKKSFAELKINVTKENNENDSKPLKMKPSKNGEKAKSNFLCVSALPKEFFECSVDFDETMKMFIDAEKIPITKSPPQNNNANGTKLKLSKFKNNSGNPSRNNLENSFRNNSGNLLRNLRKYKNLKKGNRKLQLVKKTEKKKNNLLKKRNSSSAIKLSFRSAKASKKLKRRKSAVITPKVTNIPDVNAVQVPVNEGVKIGGQSLSVEQPVSHQKRRESVLNSPQKKKPDEHKKPKENKAVPKSVKAFMEKSFYIIDLSHQNECTSSDTLLDHNYASKPEQIDKNYIMNVIVGQPLVSNADEKLQQVVAGAARKPSEEKKDVRIAPADVDNKLADASSEQQTLRPSNHLIKIKASPETPVVQEEKAEVVKKKQKLSVTPIKFNYNNFSDELNMTVKNKIFDDKMSLTVNDKPPVNIFEDSAYLQSPMSLSDTCMKEILDNLGGDLSNEEVSPIIGGRNRTHYIPLNSSLEVKPLHKSLMRSKRKLWPRSADATDSTWDGKIKRHGDDKRSYSIQISKRHGTIVNVFYLDFNLIIAQEQVISFWSQSALGNMLSAQNMWISKGSVQRLVTDGNCIFKKSPQAVISLENSVAYVELWIKEHKSDKRERPVADIFATIYFCRHHLNGPDKKVLQLENINGIASDVQYVVLRNSRNIIVSWCETCDDSRKTYIHCYNLASDYQTVVSIRQMGNVDHYITSLHNIEDCDTLVMGCGEHKVSLWNVEYGYVVASIAIDDIRSEPSTLWVKCDRGFLFMLQFYELENMFKLIAINGIHHSWKRLKMFTFPSGYKGLRGVCLDNNILGAFYNNGIVCWNIQTGESVIEEMCSENVYIPSEKHIIILSQNGILVRHALSHFITSYDL